MAIRHELSWSASRGRLFDECARAYYWTYYGSWGGWNRSEGDLAREAWLLKKLTRLPMWTGDCLHEALAWWFGERERGRTPGAEAVEARALDRMREGYRESRDGLWRERPGKRTHLAEHRYEESEVDEPSGRAAEYGGRYVERVRAGVRAFFDLDELAPAREADPSTYLACEAMGTMELFGTKVYAVPDFAWSDGGVVRILDWKTGRPADGDRFQLALYALYAEEAWGADPTAVRCADVYLGEGMIEEHAFEREELDGVLGAIEASLERMRAVHYDADRETRGPDGFPMLGEDERSLRVCARCNFRALCGR